MYLINVKATITRHLITTQISNLTLVFPVFETSNYKK